MLEGVRQLPLEIGPQPQPRFDNFIATGNEQAVEALRALAAGSSGWSPVYLWGDAGAGKTHLLRALSWQLARRGRHADWFDAALPLPWALDDAASAVLIDDCDELDVPRQQAAFALFIEAAGRQLPVAACGRMPPVDLPLREDLRTRLGWGLVCQLHPLDETQRRAVLAQAARTRGIELGEDVTSYLLTHFDRDLGSLMHLLDRLDRYALATQRHVTLALLRRMLSGEP